MLSRHRLLMTAAIAAMSPGPASAFDLAEGQVRIQLRSHAVARHREVTLGDIAVLHTSDLHTIQRLSALPLGRAPVVGAHVTLRRDAVERWIRRQLGIRSDQVRWTGPDETQVRTSAQEVPATQIEQAAKAALGDWLAERTSRHRIEVFELGSDISLPRGKVVLKARPLPANGQPTPRMVVWMDVEVDGQLVRTVPVSLAVEAHRERWVAPEPIAGGVAISAGRVEKREFELTRGFAAPLPANTARTAQPAAHWRTTRALQEDEALAARNIAPAPAVARGDWVAVHLRSGLIELESRAEALQDGNLGEIVKVRSSKAAAPLQARVVAPGRVEAGP